MKLTFIESFLPRPLQPVRRPRRLPRDRTPETLEPRCMLAAEVADAPFADLFRTSPALFVENQGQWSDDEIRFTYFGNNANVLHTTSGPILQLFRSHPQPTELPRISAVAPYDPEPTTTDFASLAVTFDEAHAVSPVGQEQAELVQNFFLGSPATWRSQVATYETVAYPGLYDGIDLATWGNRQSLKYEFYVAPHADYRQIQISYDGIESLEIDEQGRLRVETQFGELIDDAPYSYQSIDGQIVEVASSFVLIDEDTYSFQIHGAYDPGLELVIDPDVNWSSYLGAGFDDLGRDVAVDEDGNILTTGWTGSLGWISGGFDTTLNGQVDAFVAKFSPEGTPLWSTYLGGNSTDYGERLAIDSENNVLVAGRTNSGGWVQGGYDISYGNVGDGFVAKLTSDGQHAWSSYLGGTNQDRALAVAVDAGDEIVVAGETLSRGWVSGGFNEEYSGNTDAFAVKLGSNGVHKWSTYLGGSQGDQAFGVDISDDGSVVVAGKTLSSNWTTSGYDTDRNGTDGFVAKIDTTGLHEWSTYVGGASVDLIHDVSLDARGHVFVAGQTQSQNWASGGYDTEYGGDLDGFVARITASGQFEWSSYLGGNKADEALGLRVDAGGNVLVTGSTLSTDWVAGGFDTEHGGNLDGFLAKLRPDGTHNWSSYVGGSGNDVASGVDVRGTALVHVAGVTGSSGWIQGGADTTLGSAQDGFVMQVLAEGTKVEVTEGNLRLWDDELDGNDHRLFISYDSSTDFLRLSSDDAPLIGLAGTIQDAGTVLVPLASVSNGRFTVETERGDDQLTIDYSTGSFFKFAGGISFAAAEGVDVLHIVGDDGLDVSVQPDASAQYAAILEIQSPTDTATIQVSDVESHSLRAFDALELATPTGADEVHLQAVADESELVEVTWNNDLVGPGVLQFSETSRLIVDTGRRDAAGEGDDVIHQDLTLPSVPWLTDLFLIMGGGDDLFDPGDAALSLPGILRLEADNLALPDGLTLTGTTVVQVAGNILEPILADAGVRIEIVGDARLGDDSSFRGFRTEGEINVQEHDLALDAMGLVNLGFLTTIAGGALLANDGVTLEPGDTLWGHGQVTGRVAAAIGSTISADGDLALGDTESLAGFFSDGELYINDQAVTLNDANHAVLGALSQLGHTQGAGTLHAANGVVLENGKALSGYGVVTADFENQGSVVGVGPIESDEIDFQGDVTGSGDFSGNITISGRFLPGNSPGRVRVDGRLNLDATSTLLLELGGLDPATDFDQVEVSRELQLAGKLQIELINGYLPALGDEFEVLRFGTRSGVFSEHSGLLLSNGLRLSPIYEEERMLLRVVADSAPPQVETWSLNTGITDPNDLPIGRQPTDWATQRSRISRIELTFSEVVTVDVTQIKLTNLGVEAPVDDDVVVELNAAQLTTIDNVVILEFEQRRLEDGVYRLELLPGIVDEDGNPLDGDGDGMGGDSWQRQGDSTNTFYQLTSDWNADQGVSIFDFSTFAYWFGEAIPQAPSYVDLNEDQGVSIFDLPTFAARFGQGIVFPVPALARPRADLPATERHAPLAHEARVPAFHVARLRHALAPQAIASPHAAHDDALLAVLAEWQPRVYWERASDDVRREQTAPDPVRNELPADELPADELAEDRLL